MSEQHNFELFNALRNVVLVIDANGKILFVNTSGIKTLPSSGQLPSSIFELLQDNRLSESLREHIQTTKKDEYIFSALVRNQVLHFHVTRTGEYFVCNGQSETDIESMYQLQVSSRIKLMEIKSRLLAICMMDKSDFDAALLLILRAAAEILNCERLSFWLVGEKQESISCYKLYLKSILDFSNDTGISILHKHEAAAYFDYINKEYAFVLADDIATHPATKDFYESYSKPLNLKSLLDVPVWHNGRLYGIICAEQVGIKMRWQLEDVQFMLSLSDSVSLCLQTRDRLETEKQLREVNTKLSRSNNDLEHFATVASHDLKSPLRTIVNFLSLLKKNHGENLPSAAKEYIDYSIQNASHLTQLINGLLAYARVDQQIAEPEQVDINDLVNQICRDQGTFIRERNGKVELKNTLPILNVQRTLLYQMFSNIIHNAIKYTHTHNPPHLEISSQLNGEYLYVTFADNGIGIDDQYAEKIFSLFGRAHSLDEFDGTGIGLATCKKIAEVLGGKITYQRRKEPSGSIFKVWLPLKYSQS
ncbi:MAG: ATP-binding protein [Chitinophagales bacterium]